MTMQKRMPTDVPLPIGEIPEKLVRQMDAIERSEILRRTIQVATENSAATFASIVQGVSRCRRRLELGC